MTPDPDRAFTLHHRAVGLAATVEVAWIELGRTLTTIRNERLYEVLGHPTFESYLADPDLASISRTQSFRLMRIVEAYEPAMLPAETLAQVGVKKLDLVRPIIEQVPPVEREEWMDKARELSYSDLRTEVEAWKGYEQTPEQAFLERTAARLIDLARQLPGHHAPIDHVDAIVRVCASARDWLWENRRGS